MVQMTEADVRRLKELDEKAAKIKAANKTRNLRNQKRDAFVKKYFESHASEGDLKAYNAIV